ncbi:Qercetin 2,3-dioxygenase [Shigella dysenteriae CDC 74-1112]|nr:Qercetin 2,3-dioxygenase [Shigella dysenteriae CDC 74-1112]
MESLPRQRSVTVRSAAGLKLNGIFEACLFAGFLARSGRVLMHASGVLPRR